MVEIFAKFKITENTKHVRTKIDATIESKYVHGISSTFRCPNVKISHYLGRLQGDFGKLVRSCICVCLIGRNFGDREEIHFHEKMTSFHNLNETSFRKICTLLIRTDSLEFTHF